MNAWVFLMKNWKPFQVLLSRWEEFQNLTQNLLQKECQDIEWGQSNSVCKYCMCDTCTWACHRMACVRSTVSPYARKWGALPTFLSRCFLIHMKNWILLFFFFFSQQGNPRTCQQQRVPQGNSLISRCFDILMEKLAEWSLHCTITWPRWNDPVWKQRWHVPLRVKVSRTFACFRILTALQRKFSLVYKLVLFHGN